jgi:uridylate kinase
MTENGRSSLAGLNIENVEAVAMQIDKVVQETQQVWIIAVVGLASGYDQAKVVGHAAVQQPHMGCLITNRFGNWRCATQSSRGKQIELVSSHSAG